MQSIFHLQEFLDFTFHQLVHWHTGPAADDFGNIFAIHFFLQHLPAGLKAGQILLFGVERGFELLQLAVLKFGGLVVIVIALGSLDFNSRVVHGVPKLGNLVDRLAFLIPSAAEGISFFLQAGQFVLK